MESPATASIARADGNAIIVPAEGIAKSVYFIRIPEKDVIHARTVVELGIYRDGKKIETVKAKFIGPVSKASDAKRN